MPTFTRLALSELQRIDVSPNARVMIIERITETLFAYVDWMSQQVVEVYEEERERWLETRNSMRALRVREVLAGRESVDIDSAITAIRYPLRWHHVALLVWYPGAGGQADELVRMQRFVRELGEAVRAGAAPLFIAADRSTGWVWLSFQAAPDGIVAAIREFLATASGFAERGDRFAGRWGQTIPPIACASRRDPVGCSSAQARRADCRG